MNITTICVAILIMAIVIYVFRKNVESFGHFAHGGYAHGGYANGDNEHLGGNPWNFGRPWENTWMSSWRDRSVPQQKDKVQLDANANAQKPVYLTVPFTQMPQIDYNSATPPTNLNVTLLSNGHVNPVLAINGIPQKTLQLDKERLYYFHVFTPGANFVITDSAGNELINPVTNQTIGVIFPMHSPDKLYYKSHAFPHAGGIIYLNNIRGKNSSTYGNRVDYHDLNDYNYDMYN